MGDGVNRPRPIASVSPAAPKGDSGRLDSGVLQIRPASEPIFSPLVVVTAAPLAPLIASGSVTVIALEDRLKDGVGRDADMDVLVARRHIPFAVVGEPRLPAVILLALVEAMRRKI